MNGQLLTHNCNNIVNYYGTTYNLPLLYYTHCKASVQTLLLIFCVPASLNKHVKSYYTLLVKIDSLRINTYFWNVLQQRVSTYNWSINHFIAWCFIEFVFMETSKENLPLQNWFSRTGRRLYTCNVHACAFPVWVSINASALI